MKALIFGGAGFVGHRLVATLREIGHTPVVFDNLSGNVATNVSTLAQTLLIKGDIMDVGAVRSAIAAVRPDIVYNLAAVHFIPLCETNPLLAFKTNVEGCVNILEAMRAADVSRAVLISSGAVYLPSEMPLDEYSSPVSAQDVYGMTKLQMEVAGELFHRRGMQVTTIRLFNVIGPGETNPHLVPEIIQQIKSGCSSVRLGNTTPKRDYVYVDDVADNLARFVNAEPPSEHELLNLGTGSQFSVGEVVSELSALLHRPIKIEVDPAKVRRVDKPNQCASLTRMRRRLNWSPRYSLRESLRALLKYEGLMQ